MEIALLIIVAICVIALIYISKRRKELEIDTPVGPTADPNDDDNPPKKEEKASNSDQHMIYEFTARSGICRCPFCDGENGAGSRVCDICGRDI